MIQYDSLSLSLIKKKRIHCSLSSPSRLEWPESARPHGHNQWPPPKWLLCVHAQIWRYFYVFRSVATIYTILNLYGETPRCCWNPDTVLFNHHTFFLFYSNPLLWVTSPFVALKSQSNHVGSKKVDVFGCFWLKKHQTPKISETSKVESSKPKIFKTKIDCNSKKQPSSAKISAIFSPASQAKLAKPVKRKVANCGTIAGKSLRSTCTTGIKHQPTRAFQSTEFLCFHHFLGRPKFLVGLLNINDILCQCQQLTVEAVDVTAESNPKRSQENHMRNWTNSSLILIYNLNTYTWKGSSNRDFVGIKKSSPKKFETKKSPASAVLHGQRCHGPHHRNDRSGRNGFSGVLRRGGLKNRRRCGKEVGTVWATWILLSTSVSKLWECHIVIKLDCCESVICKQLVVNNWNQVHLTIFKRMQTNHISLT